jgi:beta-galactosidase/beta-glucuronidase
MTALAADIPWPEHPRPDFQRSPWVNLNGQWGFDFDPQDAGEKEQWFAPGKHAFSKKIVVPFPWESKLSGIGDKDYKGVAWYSREVTLPNGEGWKGKNAWLIVGACDWEAKVWVNGQPAGEHVGGYLPFEVNLSKFGKPGEKVIVVIRAKDVTDDQQPTGKQIGWYTRTSGIWQTVYVEARGKAHITHFRMKPDIQLGQAQYNVRLVPESQTVQGHSVRITSPEPAFEPVKQPVRLQEFRRGIKDAGTEGQVTVTVKILQPQLWSPESPKLYPVVIELLKDEETVDRVETYFGLRQITTAKAPGRDYKYIYLNGKPIYLAGALHQSFHPDGIYQYPNDAVMRSDYELCKKIGINFLRIHIKTPVPRELYWADKLGVMIMQDMPNFWNNTGQARKWYEDMLREAMTRDFNHPAIFAWVDFNESWGLDHPGPCDEERQRWVEKIHENTKRSDPTRLVEDNSPCKYDHVVTDINSWHFYINDYAEAKKHIQEVVDKTFPGSTFNYIGGRKQTDAPLMNSEYGGISAGHLLVLQVPDQRAA